MGFKNDDRCLNKVADDEPIFVLRAQDRSAPAMIRSWVSWNYSTLDQKHIDEALACAEAMEEWPFRRNPT